MLMWVAVMRPLFSVTLATSWLLANEGEAIAAKRAAARAILVDLVIVSLLYRQGFPGVD